MTLSKRAKLLATTMFIGAASLMNAQAEETRNTQTNEPAPIVQNTNETSTWEDIGTFFTDVGSGIADAAEWTYDNALKPAGQGIAAGAEWTYDGIADGVRTASDYVGLTTPEEGSENLRANPMRPAEYEAQQAQINAQREQEQARINQMRQTYENVTPGMYNNPQIVQPETTFLEDVGTFFSDVGDGIATGAEWTYDNALKPAGQGIAAGAEWTYDNALKPAGQGIAAGAEWTYDNALKPAGQGIAAGAGFVYDEALVPTGEAISEGAQYVMRGFSPLPTPQDTAYVETLPDFGTFSDNLELEESVETLTPQDLPSDTMSVEAPMTPANDKTADVQNDLTTIQAETDTLKTPTQSMDAEQVAEPIVPDQANSLNTQQSTENGNEAAIKAEKEEISPVLINAYATLKEEKSSPAPNYEMLTLILPPESIQGPMMKERPSMEKQSIQSASQTEKTAVLNKPHHSLVIEEETEESLAPQIEKTQEDNENISFKKLTEALMNAQTETSLASELPREKQKPSKTAQYTLKKETAALKPKIKITPKAWVIDADTLSADSLNQLEKHPGNISNLTLKGLTNADYSKVNKLIQTHPDKFNLETLAIENHHLKTPTISIPVKAPKYDFSKADLKEVEKIKILPTQNTLNLSLNNLDHDDIDFSNCQKIEALNLSLHHSSSVQDLKLPPQLKKLTLDTDNAELVEKMRQKYPSIEIVVPNKEKTGKNASKTLSISDTLRQHLQPQSDVNVGKIKAVQNKGRS